MNKSSTLSLNTVDYPFETLLQRVSSEPPKLILNPDFQRKYKWDKEGWARASKFIESCIMRIPLPSCYFAETDSGAHLVIDGVQRITTIVRFMQDDFALEEMTAFPELEGKRFSELGPMKSDIESTTIRCIVLRRENPEHLVTEIFSRLNQGAVMLSDQEIRHALHPGEFDLLLQELSQKDIIKNFGLGRGGTAKRDGREAEELVLRFFAFSEDASKYLDNLRKFLDAYMSKAAQYDTQKVDEMRSSFNNSLDACAIVFDRDEVFTDISRNRPRQGIVYYDLLMGTLGKIAHPVLTAKRDAIRAAFSELCKSDSFKRSLAGGLQRKSSITKRTEEWNKRLEAALN